MKRFLKMCYEEFKTKFEEAMQERIEEKMLSLGLPAESAGRIQAVHKQAEELQLPYNCWGYLCKAAVVCLIATTVFWGIFHCTGLAVLTQVNLTWLQCYGILVLKVLLLNRSRVSSADIMKHVAIFSELFKVEFKSETNGSITTTTMLGPDDADE